MKLRHVVVAVAVVVTVVTAFVQAVEAQVITRGRAIVDRPKSATPGTNCRIVNVPVTQPDGTKIVQQRRICD